MNSLERAIMNVEDYINNQIDNDDIKYDIQMLIDYIKEKQKFNLNLSSLLNSIENVSEDMRKLAYDLDNEYLNIEELIK